MAQARAAGASGEEELGGEAAPRAIGDASEEREPLGWQPIAALVLSLLALADSVYLTITHFVHGALVCQVNSVVDCAAVTTSSQSEIFGVIPVALVGLGFYVVMTLVNLPPAWRSTDERVVWLRLALVVSGMGMVFYLLYAELVQIRHICEYCTGVHICTFLLFVLVVSSLPTKLAQVRAARA